MSGSQRSSGGQQEYTKATIGFHWKKSWYSIIIEQQNGATPLHLASDGGSWESRTSHWKRYVKMASVALNGLKKAFNFHPDNYLSPFSPTQKQPFYTHKQSD